ncbi:hypothetical protein [Halomarina oriensis]|uniref:Uncharacterized protein n=1 Tax=Halomarina oriensis TaxID=671145 RepID=A0A6B0GUS2_9EURY|nr:hypothetical protein [Halomarina oriensis]MWG35885.1 hypothetical protein [Halomarina oriensis]
MDFHLDTGAQCARWTVETLVGVGLLARAIAHFFAVEFIADVPPDEYEWAVGIESDLAVRDAGLSPDQELFVRLFTLYVGALALFLHGSAFVDVAGGSPLLLTWACANWLVLVVDPVLGLRRF